MKKSFISYFLTTLILLWIFNLVIVFVVAREDKSLTKLEDSIIGWEEEAPIEVDNEVDIVDDTGDNPVEPEEELPEKKVSFLAVGDIIPHLGVTYDLEDKSYVHQYSEVKDLIQGADFAFANLESPIVNGKEPSGFPRFNGTVALVDSLKEVGFNILGTANNHVLDQSLSGFYETVNLVRDRGLTQVGGRLSDEEKNYKLVEKNGIKLGITAYTYAYNGLDVNLDKDHHALSKIDLDKIKKDFEQMQEGSPDFNIVFIHWGNEYRTKLSEAQLEIGKELKELGYHLVVGSHPHVVQKVEVEKDHVIAYSLGNFISNQRKIDIGKDAVENGLIFTCNLVMKGEEKFIEDVVVHPTWVKRRIENKKYTFKILPVEDVLDNLDNYDLSQDEIRRIEKSFKDTKFAIDL